MQILTCMHFVTKQVSVWLLRKILFIIRTLALTHAFLGIGYWLCSVWTYRDFYWVHEYTKSLIMGLYCLINLINYERRELLVPSAITALNKVPCWHNRKLGWMNAYMKMLYTAVFIWLFRCWNSCENKSPSGIINLDQSEWNNMFSVVIIFPL